MSEQTERAFQKQPTVFSSHKTFTGNTYKT
jgi:hypothetical protein